MDRIDTLLQKIDALERFNGDEIILHNRDQTLTGLFTNFLRYLLDEWVAEPVEKIDASRLAGQIDYIINRPDGVRFPSRDNVERYLREWPQDGYVLLPLVVVRWLMRNAHIRVIVPYLGDEWREFVTRYHRVIAALDSGFIVSENDQ